MEQPALIELILGGFGGVLTIVLTLFGWFWSRINTVQRELNDRIDGERDAQNAARAKESTAIWQRLTAMADHASEQNQKILERLGALATRADMTALADRFDRLRDRPQVGD